MKEKTACIIGLMFSIAIIVFTGMKIIPVEVFCSLAAGAIVWFFKEKEKESEIKRIIDKLK
jgi:hypothetical protein